MWQHEQTVQWDGINYNQEGFWGPGWSPFLGFVLWVVFLLVFGSFWVIRNALIFYYLDL